MSKWWKCDLQVATPGEPRFRAPDIDWHPETESGRTEAADRYMSEVLAAGIEVIALADHNSAAWVDTMVDAARRVGVVVFPGLEVTSGTGADGVHLIILGTPECTGAQLELLLATACGFDGDHPRFNPRRSEEPLPSPRTLPQILDALPDDFLAIAPHGFGDNGLVSANTLEGTLRWKALHHDRLGAIDVGDVSPDDLAGNFDPGNTDSWRRRFVRRELNDFPRLSSLAFIATSDAYSLGEIGRRFTWVRMASPTLEALRQAFLDHEARIVCNWDPRYKGTPNTPNDVTHAWIRQITLNGISTADAPVTVQFDPRMTVLIGGRGSGKSTVVAGLRSLYSDLTSLPEQARAEAQRFEDAVFAEAQVETTHHLPFSGESQTATWSRTNGSRTVRADGQVTPTDFRARIISQKELFERAANTRDNPHATSRNLLHLVDDALNGRAFGSNSARGFTAQVDEARTAWVSAARRLESEKAAVATRVQVEERVEELRRQVSAFDNEANRARRSRNDRWLAEARWLDSATARLSDGIAAISVEVDAQLPNEPLEMPAGGPSASDGLTELTQQLVAIRDGLRAAVLTLTSAAEAALSELSASRRVSRWQEDVTAASDDSRAYLQELAELGLDPNAYGQVRSQLVDEESVLDDLTRRSERIPALGHDADGAWTNLESLYQERHEQRQELLNEIATRSGMLRFTLRPASDTASWVERVRELLSLRSDGFLEDVPSLAKWLWDDHPDRANRFDTWRAACITGDFRGLARQANMRGQWVERLGGLDPLVRTRLAGEIADETVSMEFRRDTGATGGLEQWEPLTAGSPGQRSAAMLSFVLHQGNEPLVLDQPEDDLDTEWITQLVVTQLRRSRWKRQVVIVTHNANIPVNADAERVVVMENTGEGIKIRQSSGEDGYAVEHCGAIENHLVRADIQQIMEGGVEAFVRRERRYNNELSTYRAALHATRVSGRDTVQ